MFAARKHILFKISVVTFEVSSWTEFNLDSWAYSARLDSLASGVGVFVAPPKNLTLRFRPSHPFLSHPMR